ncbi:hypothetical protein HELRODRAFT_175911 [Helobdella robusta]|uniref:Uncharacterized protein n=1 Tax=Helobdella robusta TaxID=6412 RepID=T1F9V4_HELRO|nr:hypothetical protein HELRODRAFT_175911 [Helobdella robusta]ESO00470.1 hypothetical protein HELRODRAFT_175911 [Helobdella robusta]
MATRQDDESLICNICNFYTNEDIVSALKTLKSEFDNFKDEEMEKSLPKGATRKNDKLIECLVILKVMKLNNILDKCTIFASANMNKVPSLDKVVQINFENIRKELKEMLDMQQACLFRTLDSHAKQISALKNIINNAAPNIEKVRTSESVIKNNAIVSQDKVNPTTNNTRSSNNNSTNSNLWSMAVVTQTEKNRKTFHAG